MSEEKGDENVPPQGADVQEKIIFLIRHAESRSNSSSTDLKGAMGRVRRFKLPSGGQLKNGMGLLKLNHNSELSTKGIRQVADVVQQLNMDNFLEKSKIERIFSSTMIRAMDTCDGLLDDAAERLSIDIHRFHMIQEQSAVEKLNLPSFEQRVADVRRWLAMRKENRLCLVAHGTFLRYLVNREVHFNNCTVYRVRMKIWNADGRTRYTFEQLRKLYEPFAEIREVMPDGYLDAPMYDIAVDGDDDHVAGGAPPAHRGPSSMGDEIDEMPSSAVEVTGVVSMHMPFAIEPEESASMHMPFVIEPEASAPPAP